MRVMEIYCLVGMLLATLAIAGCTKHEPATGDTSGAQLNQQNAEVSTLLNQLSLELRKYVVRTRSVPKDFDEFLAKSGTKVPPPPAGKKYAIKDQAVVLVDR